MSRATLPKGFGSGSKPGWSQRGNFVKGGSGQNGGAGRVGGGQTLGYAKMGSGSVSNATRSGRVTTPGTGGSGVKASGTRLSAGAAGALKTGSGIPRSQRAGKTINGVNKGGATVNASSKPSNGSLTKPSSGIAKGKTQAFARDDNNFIGALGGALTGTAITVATDNPVPAITGDGQLFQSIAAGESHQSQIIVPSGLAQAAAGTGKQNPSKTNGQPLGTPGKGTPTGPVATSGTGKPSVKPPPQLGSTGQINGTAPAKPSANNPTVLAGGGSGGNNQPNPNPGKPTKPNAGGAGGSGGNKPNPNKPTKPNAGGAGGSGGGAGGGDPGVGGDGIVVDGSSSFGPDADGAAVPPGALEGGAALAPAVAAIDDQDSVFGCQITELNPHGTAKRDGLLVGDVILAIGDQPTPDHNSLRAALQSAGDEVEAVFLNKENGQVERIVLHPVETLLGVTIEAVQVC